MIAMYDGECGNCFAPICEGFTEIEFHSLYGWVHADNAACDTGWDDDEEFFACAD